MSVTFCSHWKFHTFGYHALIIEDPEFEGLAVTGAGRLIGSQNRFINQIARHRLVKKPSFGSALPAQPKELIVGYLSSVCFQTEIRNRYWSVLLMVGMSCSRFCNVVEYIAQLLVIRIFISVLFD